MDGQLGALLLSHRKEQESDIIKRVLEKGPTLWCGVRTGAENFKAGEWIRRLLQEPKEGRGWMALKSHRSRVGEKWKKISPGYE